MSFTPILLLHGWGGSSASTFGAHGWEEHLAQVDRDVVSIDLPGHGPDGGSHDPDDYSDLAGMLDALIPAGQLDVIGYSLGGKLALELASRQPSRFRRLVIGGVGDNVFLPELNGSAVADALEHGLSDDASAPVRALVEYSAASRSDPLALAAVLRRRPNPIATESRLSMIAGDILIVNGTDDHLAHPDERLRHAVGPHRYAALDGIDHFVLPKTGAFKALAVQFLEADGDQPFINKTEVAVTR